MSRWLSAALIGAFVAWLAIVIALILHGSP